MQLTKEQFVKLGEAYLKDSNYLNKIDSFMFNTAREYGIETDFLGESYSQGSNLFRAVYDILQDKDDWFGYFICECEQDWDKFNTNIELKDGTHPNVHSLEELYDFINIES